MKVLLTGGSGLLALNWAASEKDKHQIVLGVHQRQVSLRGVNSASIKLDSPEDCRATLEALQPDAVVNAAGLTNVDLCEQDPDNAYRINSDMPGWLAGAAARLDIGFIHICTDHLRSDPAPLATEDDPVDPINTYAKSKYRGETNVLQTNPNALVIRTNFFGWGTTYRHSFSDNILSSLRNQRPIKLFNDVFYTPIEASVLAARSMALLQLGCCGIVNVAGDERLSKYEFGMQLADVFGLDTACIEEGSVKDASLAARRPMEMGLSTARCRRLLDIDIDPVARHIAILRDREQTDAVQEVARL